jgi:nitroimidazol reductase NimA-like FMN-containing flavoprotein (pyridoxamine 5'-phosphate oxidase superfamily)
MKHLPAGATWFAAGHYGEEPSEPATIAKWGRGRLADDGGRLVTASCGRPEDQCHETALFPPPGRTPPPNSEEDNAMESDERPGTVLSDAESWSVLERCEHGRLAVSVLGEPDIYPINFIAHDRVLLLRTTPGTKLAELTVNDKVAFEVEAVAGDEVWSVVLKGMARVIESQSEMDEAEKLPLKPWIQTRKYTYVEITPTRIHGRHFELGEEPERY